MIRNQITDEFPSDSKETLNEEEQGEESIKVGKESMEKSRKGLDLGERTSADGNGENFKFYGKKGHCSSNSIPPQTSSNTQQQQDSKAFEKRKRIMTEIVDTEIRYVADLILLKKFRDLLLSKIGTGQEIIPNRTIHDIFLHFESILAVNQELKVQLEARLKNWNSGLDQVGDIFMSLSPFLRVYSMFITNFNNASAMVGDLMGKNGRFKQFVNEIDHMTEARSLSFNAFLLTPVQRIPRYKLLLEDLFKNTSSDHPDYANLEKAIVLINEIASLINENIRDHESTLKVLDIQKSLVGLRENLVVPGRKFIKRGSVKKISRRAHQNRELLLFSDVLVYASPSLIEESTLQFHRIIKISTLIVHDIPDSEDIRNIFQLVNRDKSFAVYTETEEEKKSWIEAILNAKNVLVPSSKGKSVMSADYSAPVWMPDGHAKNCLLCFSEFTFFLRRHHCRFCGTIVCHYCSRNSFYAPSSEGERKSRVCDKCFPKVVEERKFRISVTPIPEFLDSRSSIDSNRPASESNNHHRLSIDSRRTSIDSRMSFDSCRTSNDVARLFSSRRSYMPQRKFDTMSIYSRLTGYESSADISCTLCLQSFSLTCWKYICQQCERSVCRSCTSKESSHTICDPCSLNVDPLDVMVNPLGDEWSAQF